MWVDKRDNWHIVNHGNYTSNLRRNTISREILETDRGVIAAYRNDQWYSCSTSLVRFYAVFLLFLYCFSAVYTLFFCCFVLFCAVFVLFLYCFCAVFVLFCTVLCCFCAQKNEFDRSPRTSSPLMGR